MSPQFVDPDRVETEARQLLDAKVAAVRLLATARQKLANRQAALEEAEREDATCYAAATRAGWTAEELRRVGLSAPSRRPPGRPSAARRAAPDKRVAAGRPAPSPDPPTNGKATGPQPQDREQTPER